MNATLSTLPQLGDALFLTDGGLETTLIFHDGLDLPMFASIDMLRRPGGRDHLKRYFETYLAIAEAAGTGFVLESTTWRASPDWAKPLGVSPEKLDALNHAAIALLHEIRTEHPAVSTVISGCVGPRGDGYRPEGVMRADEAEAYHARQIGIFANAGVDMVSAITMTNIPEAVGIARAATRHRVPVAISFTLETDGRLPTGDALGEAIDAVDAATSGAPAYYMINCAHPSHFAGVLAEGGAWTHRIRGLRVNASCLSHAELDAATELDDGDPVALAEDHRALLARLPMVTVLGGCCGTDHRHVEAIAGVARELRPG